MLLTHQMILNLYHIKPDQNGRKLAHDIFWWNFWNENDHISIYIVPYHYLGGDQTPCHYLNQSDTQIQWRKYVSPDLYNSTCR